MPDQQHRYGPKALPVSSRAIQLSPHAISVLLCGAENRSMAARRYFEGQRHITIGATLRIKCGAPHLMRMIDVP